MSVSIFSQGKAPYRVRLKATTTTGESASIDQPTILAACMAGPLKTYLSKIGEAAAAWGDIGQGLDPKISFSVTVVNGAININTIWQPGAPNVVAVQLSGAGSVVVEIVFNHSVVR